MEPKLKYAHLAPDVWDALAKIERTGWVMWKVKNPESVQEHIIALRALAASLADSLPDFSKEEMEELVDMLEIHDWIEAIVGDEVIFTDNPEERKAQKAALYEKEHVAMKEISSKLGEEGKKILELWLRFEKADDKIASFARQLDKYQAIEQAAEYQKTQGIPLFEEFYNYSLKSISHPVLLERLEKIKVGL
jgi:5'-deoxynucleotidase YfbR-like HD superfamily hydrolase